VSRVPGQPGLRVIVSKKIKNKHGEPGISENQDMVFTNLCL
jgi:hypothetical protein